MNRYEKFWNWLANNSSEIETLINSGQANSAAKLISKELDLISPDISWEIGVKNDEVELVLSAQGDRALGKILDEMFVDCPSIPKWKISRYKQPKSLSSLSKLIDAQGYHLELENINVQVTLNPSNTKIDVVLISPDFNQIPSDQLYNFAFFILDGILGEKMVEEWIGKIDVNVVENDSERILLSDLPEFMSELIEGL